MKQLIKGFVMTHVVKSLGQAMVMVTIGVAVLCQPLLINNSMAAPSVWTWSGACPTGSGAPTLYAPNGFCATSPTAAAPLPDGWPTATNCGGTDNATATNSYCPTGVMSAAAVPEMSDFAAGAVLLLALGAVHVIIRRKTKNVTS